MITALKVVIFCANSKQLVTMRDCFQLDQRNVNLMVECCAAVRLSTIRHVIAALMVRIEYISIHEIHVKYTQRFFFITRSEINPVLILLACQQIYEMYASPVNFAVNLTLSALATSDTIAADL